MKNHWLTALLCLLLAFAATGCGTPRDRGVKRSAGTTQTGTNIPRWTQDSSSTQQSRSKQRTAKAKREKRDTRKAKAEKAKREKRERSSSADEDIVIRGGFR